MKAAREPSTFITNKGRNNNDKISLNIHAVAVIHTMIDDSLRSTRKGFKLRKFHG